MVSRHEGTVLRDRGVRRGGRPGAPRPTATCCPRTPSHATTSSDELGLVSVGRQRDRGPRGVADALPAGCGPSSSSSFGLEGLGDRAGQARRGHRHPRRRGRRRRPESRRRATTSSPTRGRCSSPTSPPRSTATCRSRPAEVAAEGPLEARARVAVRREPLAEEPPHLIDQAPCAVLHAEEDQPPAVVPGQPRRRAARRPGSGVVGSSPWQKDQGVQAGHGAYVLSGVVHRQRRGPAVPDRRQGQGLHPRRRPTRPDQLGYGSAEHPVVPDEWVELFERECRCLVTPRCADRATDPDATC